MGHPNWYLIKGKDAVASARNNLKNVIYGLRRDSKDAPIRRTVGYSYWAHLERFWWWFKQFNRGGWIDGEEELRGAMTAVTLRHYPCMTRQEIEDEVKAVLATFLFEHGQMSTVEDERLVRFTRYIESLLVALE